MIPRKTTILIDSKFLQAMQHLLGTGEPRRLTSFLASLESISNGEIRFSEGLPFKGPHYPEWKRRMLCRVASSVPRLFTLLCHELTAKALADCDLLIITTRWRLTPYSHEEIRAIREFVVRGGGHVLMTGDSGFVCEPDVPGTGPGLLYKSDNRAFVIKAIRWLLEMS